MSEHLDLTGETLEQLAENAGVSLISARRARAGAPISERVALALAAVVGSEHLDRLRRQGRQE